MLELVHVSEENAFEGVSVLVSVYDLPFSSDREVLLSAIAVGAFFTVTLHEADIPLQVVTVIVAVPAVLPLIIPLFDTVATLVLLLLKVKAS